MPYTAQKPLQPPSATELRARIPGWGADLDRSVRPSVPKEREDLPTGAHWEFPERQEGGADRERSIEHAGVTPVFGATVPLKGLSGAIRRYAYDHFSEARAAHWLLLLAGDRVDVVESELASLATRRPVNPFLKSGLKAEFSRHGWSSRVGAGRADVQHQWMDPLVAYAPWALAAAVGVAAARAVGRRAR